MRNLIFVVLLSVFATFLAVRTVCAEDSKQTEKAVEKDNLISFAEFQARHYEIMASVSRMVADTEETLRSLDEFEEFIKNNLGEWQIRNETKEGREEYEKAIEKYFSSSE